MKMPGHNLGVPLPRRDLGCGTVLVLFSGDMHNDGLQFPCWALGKDTNVYTYIHIIYTHIMFNTDSV